MRRRWLQQYPVCVLCLVRGETTASRLEVDHLEPHRGDPDLYWEWDNLETLCRDCHSGAKHRHESRAGNADQWLDYLAETMSEQSTQQWVAPMLPLLPHRIARVLRSAAGPMPKTT